MSTTAEAMLRRRNLRTVLALAALFLVPLLVSFALYYGGIWRPPGNSNHGQLIDPARPLPEVSLPAGQGGAGTSPAVVAGKWTLVYVGGGQCDETCRRALFVMRQARLLLNQEMTRVARVFLVTAECSDGEFLAKEHAGLAVLDASGAAAAALLREFPQESRAESLYIVDPLGNLMMRFDTRQDPKGLLTDLKKLLKLSHIG